MIWGKLYRRDCFENVRYPVGKIHEDEYITHTILFQHEYISYIETPLCYYRNAPQSITRRAWTPRRMDGIEALEEQMDFFKKNNFERAYRVACCRYFYNFTYDLKMIDRFYPDGKKIWKKKNRKMLKEYGMDAGISMNTHWDLYRNAYPEYELYFLLRKKIRGTILNIYSRSVLLQKFYRFLRNIL